MAVWPSAGRQITIFNIFYTLAFRPSGLQVAAWPSAGPYSCSITYLSCLYGTGHSKGRLALSWPPVHSIAYYRIIIIIHWPDISLSVILLAFKRPPVPQGPTGHFYLLQIILTCTHAFRMAAWASGRHLSFTLYTDCVVLYCGVD